MAGGDNSGIYVGGSVGGDIHQYIGTTPLWRPRFHPTPINIPATGDEANRFTYTAQRTRFLGRDGEMAQLRAFRDRPEVFRWWLVTGSGGMGKSRLALEFCQETEKIGEAKPAEKKPGWWRALLPWRKKRQIQAPPPVWTCGFVNMDGAEEAAELAGWAQWQPERPTLLVVDYVAKRAKFVGQVVVALAQDHVPGRGVTAASR